MSEESKRSAVQIYCNLSSYLINVALAMFAILGSILVFIAGNFQRSIFLLIFVGLAVFSLISSIYFGGKGIDISARKGENDDWNLDHGSSFFNLQAIFIFIAFLFVLAAIFSVGKSKAEKNDNQLKSLTTKIEVIQKETVELKKALNTLQTNNHTSNNKGHQNAIQEIKKSLVDLDKRIESIEKEVIIEKEPEK